MFYPQAALTQHPSWASLLTGLSQMKSCWRLQCLLLLQSVDVERSREQGEAAGRRPLQLTSSHLVHPAAAERRLVRSHSSFIIWVCREVGGGMLV